MQGTLNQSKSLLNFFTEGFECKSYLNSTEVHLLKNGEEKKHAEEF